MINIKHIFLGDKKISRIAVSGVLVALFMGVVGAATNYGCDDENNDSITPELALCSVHAYNIAKIDNEFATGEKELVRDVVALKTTVMTQQMYKQYEYLESTVKRFKTQLEKAVLTTKLQMAGASNGSDDASSSGGGFSSTDRNVYINGVQNCNNELTPLKVFECLNNNLNTISNTSGNGTALTVELRKQLANDFNTAKTELAITTTASSDSLVKDCGDYKQIGQKKAFQSCLDTLRSYIRRGYSDEQQKQNRQQQYNKI